MFIETVTMNLKSTLRIISFLTAATRASAFVPQATGTHGTRYLFSSSSSSSAISSLPSLLDVGGKQLSGEEVSEHLKGKRIAYYYAAGWCPMCTSFEPSLLQFRQAANDSGKDIELIYVPSDRSSDAAIQRSSAMNMLSVPFGEDADKLKKEFGVWAGSEALKFGFGGRRSGVPALVVLSGETGEELEFLPAESQGVAALKAWPLEDDKGVW